MKNLSQTGRNRIAWALVAFQVILLLGVTTFQNSKPAEAQVSRPAAASLTTGDIKSSHIFDGTIVNADVSSTAAIAESKISQGVRTIANGGTGTSSLPAGVLIASGTTALSAVAPGTLNNVLVSDGSSWTSNTSPGGVPAGTILPFSGPKTGVVASGTTAGNCGPCDSKTLTLSMTTSTTGLVVVNVWENAGDRINAVNINGVSSTLAGKTFIGDFWNYLYYYATTTGGNMSVVINGPGASQILSNAVAYQGISQTNTLDSVASASSSAGGLFSVPITSASSSEFIVFSAVSELGTITASASSTARSGSGGNYVLLDTNDSMANPKTFYPSFVASAGNISLVAATFRAAVNNAGTNFLFADGGAVSRTTYSTLFNMIGTTYGTGDGSTTFTLPDMYAKIPLGMGTTAINLGTTKDATTSTASGLKFYGQNFLIKI